MYIKMPPLLLTLLAVLSCGSHHTDHAKKTDKPRLLVLTDIGADPDDTQSLRRLLVYANEFRIEGLIATASGHFASDEDFRIRTDLILDAINDYSQVRENLLLHAPGYPPSEALRPVVHGGQAERGVSNLAAGRETPGSRHIIETVDSGNEPLYIAIWGGAHDLAQALLDIKNTRSQKEVKRFTEKIRIYAIGDQDAWIGQKGTGEWIRENFPDIRYVESGPPSIHIMTSAFRGMYQNDSRGGDHPLLPLVRSGMEQLNDQQWVMENVNAWGPLGAGYPSSVVQNPRSERNTKGVKEGDTPSWFFVFPYGLNDPEHPEWGGWGGRFVHQGGGHYIDAGDDHWSGEDDSSLRRKWTVARWREAYQNDFAARMRWTVLPYDEANHNPVVIIDHDTTSRILRRNIKPGSTVTIDASASHDPDGDDIDFNWWVYREISSSGVILSSARNSAVIAEVPEGMEKGEVHLILEVKDDGNPELYAYRRIILRVD